MFDAVLVDGTATDWIPAGDSAWQFKGGPFAPGGCADELAGAEWAQELLRGGASYIMVIAERIGARAVGNREKALRDKASELGLALADPNKIRVIDANALARWTSEIVPLAVSEFFRGPGWSVVDFAQWSRSSRHGLTWVENDIKRRAIQTIRDALRVDGRVDIRVQGESGLGKTRLVMEALRADPWPPLVVYVSAFDNLSPDVLTYLMNGRLGVVVVDECEARQHDKLLERIPSDSKLKLITIGEVSDYPLVTPAISPGRLEGTDLDTFLQTNFRELWPEARRLVAEYCNSNLRFAEIIASRIRAQDPTHAVELVRQGDIETFVSDMLPEGSRTFFLSSLLALTERVGWEGGLEGQLEALADFGDVLVSELRELGRQLEQLGLLVQQGRYRSIAPRPLAVVLAGTAWREHGQQIIDRLLPTMDREMILSLFIRAAQLGGYGPSKEVLEHLISPDGPFGSLGSIEDHGLADFIIQLAIISPDVTVDHVHSLIQAESLEALKERTTSRRNLVWALEKLAWHSSTFERAADALLRLALAENETYANNATGTWLALFGAALPATAASPAQRVAYVADTATSPNPDIRKLAVEAAAHGVSTWESVTVSAEIQGGVLVERRGGINTDEERGQYRTQMIAILRARLRDQEPEVANAAAEVLVKAVHPLITDPYCGRALEEALTQLPGSGLDKLRQSISHLHGLFERHPDPAMTRALDHLATLLPRIDETDELRLLLQTQPWELEDTEQRPRLEQLVRDMAESGTVDLIYGWLSEEQLPSAWFVGHVLGSQPRAQQEGIRQALVGAATKNVPALGGYLAALVEGGSTDAFDQVLSDAPGLEPSTVLWLSVQGPVTDQALQRIARLLPEVPVAAAARLLVGWHHKVSTQQLREELTPLISRVASQDDYNAVVSVFSLVTHGADQVADALAEPIWELVARRRQFPNVGGENWGWVRLAERSISTRADVLGELLLDLIGSELVVLASDEEARLLQRIAGEIPERLWEDTGRRLLAGEWRLTLALRGWFTGAFPVDVITRWIGSSEERAQVVASIAAVGGAEPTPVARYLLESFEAFEEVGNSLAAEFMSGSWTGPASSRTAGLIGNLEGWRRSRSEPAAVKRWAAKMIHDLEERREAELQWEAERGW